MSYKHKKLGRQVLFGIHYPTKGFADFNKFSVLQKLSESNGQPAYPTYELAPYRLATVAAGLFVAFIWTIVCIIIPRSHLTC